MHGLRVLNGLQMDLQLAEVRDGPDLHRDIHQNIPIAVEERRVEAILDTDDVDVRVRLERFVQAHGAGVDTDIAKRGAVLACAWARPVRHRACVSEVVCQLALPGLRPASVCQPFDKV